VSWLNAPMASQLRTLLAIGTNYCRQQITAANKILMTIDFVNIIYNKLSWLTMYRIYIAASG